MSLGSHSFDLLNGICAALRGRRFVRNQTCGDSTLAGLYFPAHACYLGFASNYPVFQEVRRRLRTSRGFPQFERTFRTYLVLMGLHAINHAALARRHAFAIFLDVRSAGL